MTNQEKREPLAMDDADNWGFMTTYDVALEGCTGYNNMTDEEVSQLYNDFLE